MLCPSDLAPLPAMRGQTPACLVAAAPPGARCPGAAWQLLLLRLPAETAVPANNGRWPSQQSHSWPVSPPPSPCQADHPLLPILVHDSLPQLAIQQKLEGVYGSGGIDRPTALPPADPHPGPQDHETLPLEVQAGVPLAGQLHETGCRTCAALLRTLHQGVLLVDQCLC